MKNVGCSKLKLLPGYWNIWKGEAIFSYVILTLIQLFYFHMKTQDVTVFSDISVNNWETLVQNFPQKYELSPNLIITVTEISLI